MIIKYICHHTTSNGIKYDNSFSTLEEAQLDEAKYGGWIEKKITTGLSDEYAKN